MKELLDIQSSFDDSPDFRIKLSQAEQSIWSLESTVKAMMKSVKTSVDLANGSVPSDL
jgi:hypothetical protein